MNMIELTILVSEGAYAKKIRKKMAFNIDNISYIGASKELPKERSFMRLKSNDNFFNVMHPYPYLLDAIRNGLTEPLSSGTV